MYSRSFLTLAFVLFIYVLPTRAQISDWEGFMITCAARDTAAGAFLPPAAAVMTGDAQQKSSFILDFTSEVPDEAREAIEFASRVWGAYLNSAVPIRVEVDWQDRDDRRLLASAGPGTLFRGIPGGEPNVWYPVALAESIVGLDLNELTSPDIRISANSTANWYFGTDGNTPRNRIDLVSVILHEMGHGLGFLSSVDTVGTDQLAIGFDGRFIIYDLFLESEAGVPLSDPSVFGSPSPELLQAVSRDELFFNGLRANQEFGEDVPLFAPPVFDGGSSVSHLEEFAFRPGSENALMTPFISAGEAVHDPGPIALGIFADMGWDVEFEILSSVATAAEQGVSVFPNPVADRLTVQLAAGSETTRLLLMSATGRTVRSVILAPGSLRSELQVGDLPPGFYVLLGEGPRVWRQALVIN